jgi:hypothetical protein
MRNGKRLVEKETGDTQGIAKRKSGTKYTTKSEMTQGSN